MEKQNNKSAWVIIGVLAVLIIVFIVLVGILLSKKDEDSQEKTSNVGPNVIEEQTTAKADDDIFGEEITTEQTVTGDGTIIVINGCQFVVPPEYACMYIEGLGPVVYIDDVFTLKIKVLETPTFAEVQADPASITENIAGVGTMIEDAKQIEHEGKDYVYYVADLNGVKTIVINTEVVGKRVTTQMAIESETMTYDDCIKVFASIVESGAATSAPDSTYDDIDSQDVSHVGEEKTEGTLTFQNQTVTYQIPEGFYSQGVEDWSDEAVEAFMTDDYAYYVTCRLSAKEDELENAEMLTQTNFDFLLENVKSSASIETVEVDGYVYFYYDVHYEFDGTDCQKLYAACNVGEYIYSVDVSATDAESELTLDMVKKFLTIKQ